MLVEKLVQLLIICYLTIKAETPPIEQGETTKFAMACEGRDLQLTVEYYDSLGFDWYYNTMMICQNKGSDGYRVEPSYQVKVEQCNKTGIRLRNLSLADTGNFSLKSYMEKFLTPYSQMIFLTVLASPTKGCTPSIEMHSKDVLKCSTSCGNLDTEWRFDKTGPTLGNGSFLHINCSWKVEHLWCCPQGPNMRCYQGNDSDLCASINISSFCKVPDSSDITLFIGIVVVAAIGVIIIVTIIIICCCVKKRKKQQQTASQLATNQTVDSTYIELSSKEQEETFLQLEKETEDFTHPLPSVEAVPLLEDRETANDTSHQLSNHTASQLTTNQTANSIHIQLFDPVHETKEAITEHQPSTNSEALKELQELRHAALCKICFVNKMNMVFTPCNHIATCASCSISFQTCPVCRALIKEKINILF